MNGALPAACATWFAAPFNFGALEQDLVRDQAVTRLLVACLLGGLVGAEREWKKQSAGVRTNLLICMACAFFTLMSPVLAGDLGTNRGQVAANIVQGIGFLGAGLILHDKNRVSGLASAASIFVVASIGMACGAGLYVPAMIATLIVLVSMAVIGYMEWAANIKSYPVIYETRGSDETGLLQAILDALDKQQHRLGVVNCDAIGTMRRVTFTHAATKRDHERLKAQLLAEPNIQTLKTFHISEED